MEAHFVLRVSLKIINNYDDDVYLYMVKSSFVGKPSTLHIPSRHILRSFKTNTSLLILFLFIMYFVCTLNICMVFCHYASSIIFKTLC